MARFNVLSLAGEESRISSIRKILSWHYRDHAFFQPESQAEAKRLLLLFRIHLVISDETFSPNDLAKLKEQFPEVRFISHTREQEAWQKNGVDFIPETALRNEIRNVIKAFRKDNGAETVLQSQSASFEDYTS